MLVFRVLGHSRGFPLLGSGAGGCGRGYTGGHLGFVILLDYTAGQRGGSLGILQAVHLAGKITQQDSPSQDNHSKNRKYNNTNVRAVHSVSRSFLCLEAIQIYSLIIAKSPIFRQLGCRKIPEKFCENSKFIHKKTQCPPYKQSIGFLC